MNKLNHNHNNNNTNSGKDNQEIKEDNDDLIFKHTCATMYYSVNNNNFNKY